jgi:hypothetical protein
VASDFGTITICMSLAARLRLSFLGLIVRARVISIARGFSFRQKNRTAYQGKIWGLMAADRGTADHGACRECHSHFAPSHIIFRPVPAVPTLIGSTDFPRKPRGYHRFSAPSFRALATR